MLFRRLLQMAAGRKRTAAIEHPDIVEPKKAALEHVLSVASLRFNHQVKFSSSF